MLKTLDIEKTIVCCRVGTGMSCAMFKIVQECHDKGYKIMDLIDNVKKI